MYHSSSVQPEFCILLLVLSMLQLQCAGVKSLYSLEVYPKGLPKTTLGVTCTLEKSCHTKTFTHRGVETKSSPCYSHGKKKVHPFPVMEFYISRHKKIIWSLKLSILFSQMYKNTQQIPLQYSLNKGEVKMLKLCGKNKVCPLIQQVIECLPQGHLACDC